VAEHDRRTSDPSRNARGAAPSGILLTILVLVAATVFAAAGGFLFYITREAPGQTTEPPVTVVIENGWGLARIADELEAAGVVADSRGFVLLAKRRKVAARLRAGEYAIGRGLHVGDVVEIIAEGRTVKHKFTVLPGHTAWEVAMNLQRLGLDKQKIADNLIVDKTFCDQLGVPARRLEGFLFPETYSYERNDTAKKMLTRMVRQFQKVWAEKLAAEAGTTKMGLLGIVTLASIIEKESAYRPERPQIARAFLNRLSIGMRLQADPTVIYGLGHSFHGKLTRAHLRYDHPYNTYTRKGLPPGPISNPSLDSMQAVLHPAEGDWKYFVATGKGNHTFSVTYRQHVNAIHKYQK
jgi:peptidoglycan lytic transglycosylase G